MENIEGIKQKLKETVEYMNTNTSELDKTLKTMGVQL